MRLARRTHRHEEQSLLVGVVPPPTMPAETDLEQLFLEAYRRLHGRVLDHAARFLSKQDAEDAVGDAMLSLWQRWRTLRPDQRNDNYVFGIVRHAVFATMRANRPWVSLDEVEPELDALASGAGSDPSRGQTAADVLDRALASMSARKREVFLLIREESLSYEEAAAELGISLGSVRTHYTLAIKHRRAAFTRAGFRIANVSPARLRSPDAPIATPPGALTDAQDATEGPIS